MQETTVKRRRKRNKYDGHKLEWLRITKFFVAVAAVFLLLFNFVIGLSVVDGPSMMNTLKRGDVVIYNRLSRDYSRGKVVSLYTQDQFYIKRIVACAGDVVDIRQGVLYVNGEAENADYPVGSTLPQDGGFSYPYTVPQGFLFVLGDNREQSVDSRSYGAVSEQSIKGVMTFAVGWLFVKGL